MALIQDNAVFVTASGINKTLKQAVIDGDLGAGGGGGGSTEIFNNVIILSSSAATLTGLNYFRAPSGLTISSIVVQLWTKGAVASGNLTIDIKKNNSPAAAGMTSIFSVLPTFNFASASDYSTSTGTISTSGLSGGDWLRLDVTSIPSGWSGRFSVMAYA
jgi:hypothetical protein